MNIEILDKIIENKENELKNIKNKIRKIKFLNKNKEDSFKLYFSNFKYNEIEDIISKFPYESFIYKKYIFENSSLSNKEICNLLDKIFLEQIVINSIDFSILENFNGKNKKLINKYVNKKLTPDSLNGEKILEDIKYLLNPSSYYKKLTNFILKENTLVDCLKLINYIIILSDFSSCYYIQNNNIYFDIRLIGLSLNEIYNKLINSEHYLFLCNLCYKFVRNKFYISKNISKNEYNVLFSNFYIFDIVHKNKMSNLTSIKFLKSTLKNLHYVNEEEMNEFISKKFKKTIKYMKIENVNLRNYHFLYIFLYGELDHINYLMKLHPKEDYTIFEDILKYRFYK